MPVGHSALSPGGRLPSAGSSTFFTPVS